MVKGFYTTPSRLLFPEMNYHLVDLPTDFRHISRRILTFSAVVLTKIMVVEIYEATVSSRTSSRESGTSSGIARLGREFLSVRSLER